MTWDTLIVGPRWPRCGHPRTQDNTQPRTNRPPVCKTCHQERAREYQRLQREGTKEDLERFDADNNTPDHRAIASNVRIVRGKYSH